MLRKMAGLAGLLLLGCASEGRRHDGDVGGAGGLGTTQHNNAGESGSDNAGEAGAVGEAGTAGAGACCSSVDWKEGLTGSIALDGSCDACGSGGNGCFSLGDNFRLCGVTDPPQASACAGMGSDDECGCNDLVCPDGQRCVTVHETRSGGGFEANRCLALCGTNQDCAKGQVCLPDELYLVGGVGVAQCVTPECSSDADCAEDACGHCLQARAYTFQGRSVTFPQCAYAGSAPDAGCADARPLGENAHVCHASSLPSSYSTNPR